MLYLVLRLLCDSKLVEFAFLAAVLGKLTHKENGWVFEKGHRVTGLEIKVTIFPLLLALECVNLPAGKNYVSFSFRSRGMCYADVLRTLIMVAVICPSLWPLLSR